MFIEAHTKTPAWRAMRARGGNIWTWEVMLATGIGDVRRADRVVDEMYQYLSEHQERFSGRLLADITRQEFDFVLRRAAARLRVPVRAHTVAQLSRKMRVALRNGDWWVVYESRRFGTWKEGPFGTEDAAAGHAHTRARGLPGVRWRVVEGRPAFPNVREPQVKEAFRDLVRKLPVEGLRAHHRALLAAVERDPMNPKARAWTQAAGLASAELSRRGAAPNAAARMAVVWGSDYSPVGWYTKEVIGARESWTGGPYRTADAAIRVARRQLRETRRMYPRSPVSPHVEVRGDRRLTMGNSRRNVPVPVAWRRATGAQRRAMLKVIGVDPDETGIFARQPWEGVQAFKRRLASLWQENAGRKPRLKIPKGQIEWIVNRLHVGTPDEEVAADIRRRATGQPGWTPARVEEAVRYAVQHHRRNRGLYEKVMRGQFNANAVHRRLAARANPLTEVEVDRTLKCAECHFCKALEYVKEGRLRHAAAELGAAIAHANDVMALAEREKGRLKAQVAKQKYMAAQSRLLAASGRTRTTGMQASLFGGRPGRAVVDANASYVVEYTHRERGRLRTFHKEVRARSYAEAVGIARADLDRVLGPARYQIVHAPRRGAGGNAKISARGATELARWRRAETGAQYLLRSDGHVLQKLAAEGATWKTWLRLKPATPQQWIAALDGYFAKQGVARANQLRVTEARRVRGSPEVQSVHVSDRRGYPVSMAWLDSDGRWHQRGALRVHAEVARNPKVSAEARRFIQRKVDVLLEEGVALRAALGRAYSEARRAGYRIPPPGRNPAAPLTVPRHGWHVLAKEYQGLLMAVTYANRSQAQRKAAELGPPWEVVRFGRPFLVGYKTAATNRARRNPLIPPLFIPPNAARRLAADANDRQVHRLVVSAFFDRRPARAARGRYEIDGTRLKVWGNVVAHWEDGAVIIQDAGWRTLLTKNVLNAVLDEWQRRGGKGGRIYQKAHEWWFQDERGAKRWTGSLGLPAWGLTAANRLSRRESAALLRGALQSTRTARRGATARDRAFFSGKAVGQAHAVQVFGPRKAQAVAARIRGRARKLARRNSGAVADAVVRLAVGERTDFGPFWVKRVRRREYILRDERVRERARWGNLSQILQDVAHALSYGALPAAGPRMWNPGRRRGRAAGPLAGLMDGAEARRAMRFA